MKNVFIESLTEKHGEQIIEFFNSIGVNTRNLSGCLCKAHDDPYRFYGVKENDIFSNINKNFAELHKIVTLQEAMNLFSPQQQGTTSQKQKLESMKVFKTKEVIIEGQKRTVVIAVVINEGLVRTGYSVCMPDDKFNTEMGEKIALGRAMKDKTNLTPDMVMGIGMDKKYILYAIAEHFLKVVSDGKVVKGIKPKISSVESN